MKENNTQPEREMINNQAQMIKQNKSSGLGIAALILSFLGCTFILGLILAIVDLTNKDGTNKTISKIAIGICGLWILLGILIFGSNILSAGLRYKNKESEVVTTETVKEDTDESIEKNTEKSTEKSAEKNVEKSTENTTEKSIEKSTEKAPSDLEASNQTSKNSSNISDSQKTDTRDSSIIQNEIDPDFKAFMDSYEDFIDEYVEFLKKMYDDPSDLTILSEYSDYMTEYAEFCAKVEKYGNSKDELNDAELAYYVEVTTRCSEKLLKAGISN